MRFNPEPYLEAAVTAQDNVAVRSALQTYITIMIPQGNGSEVRRAMEYALDSGMQGIIDEHDGQIFRPRENWNEQYYNSLVVNLMQNCSAARFDHILEVGSALHSPSLLGEDDARRSEAIIAPKPGNRTPQESLLKPLLWIGAAALIWLIATRVVDALRTAK